MRLLIKPYGENVLGICCGDRNCEFAKSNPRGADRLKMLSLICNV